MRAWIIFGILVFLLFRIIAIFVIPPIGDEMMQLYIAQDIAHFSNFPVYLYQQQHMGPLESYLIAPLVRLFGPSLLLGRIFSNLFYLVFVVLFLGIIRRFFGRPLATYVWVLLTVVSFPVLFLTTMFGHDEILPLAMLALVFLLRIAREKGNVSWNSFLLGVISGVAFWCNAIFGVWIAAIAVILAGMIPSSWRRGIPFLAVLGFLAGLTPMMIHWARTGVLMGLSGAGGSFVKAAALPQLFYLFFARMKYFLSSFSPGSTSPVIDQMVRYLSLIPFLIFAFSFAILLIYFIRSRREGRPEERVFYAFLILPAFALTFLYLSRNLLEDEGMRFFLPLFITYAFAVPWGILRIQNPFWRKGVWGALIAILSVGFPFSARYEYQKTAEFRELAQFLEKEGLRKGIAEFGVAYPLNALGNNRLLVTPPWYVAAYRPILDQVRKEGPQFFILATGAQRFRKKLEADPQLQKTTVSRYDIFSGDSSLLKQFTTVGELLEE